MESTKNHNFSEKRVDFKPNMFSVFGYANKELHTVKDLLLIYILLYYIYISD